LCSLCFGQSVEGRFVRGGLRWPGSQRPKGAASLGKAIWSLRQRECVCGFTHLSKLAMNKLNFSPSRIGSSPGCNSDSNSPRTCRW
jgi:hypothetical protein